MPQNDPDAYLDEDGRMNYARRRRGHGTIDFKDREGGGRRQDTEGRQFRTMQIPNETIMDVAGLEPGVVPGGSLQEFQEYKEGSTPVEIQTGQAAPAYRSGYQTDTYGARALQPGEFEVHIDPNSAASQRRRSMMDTNNNGIPDGAETRITEKSIAPDGTETVKESKFRKQSQQPTVSDTISSMRERQGQDTERALDNRSRLDRFAEKRSRNTIGGQTVSERILDQRDTIEKREHQLARDKTRYVDPVTEAEKGSTERQTMITGEKKRAADKEFEEKKRQFNAELNEAPQIWTHEGGDFITYNGQTLKLGRKDKSGQQLLDEHGRVWGFMGADGIPRTINRRDLDPSDEDDDTGKGKINKDNFVVDF